MEATRVSCLRHIHPSPDVIGAYVTPAHHLRARPLSTRPARIAVIVAVAATLVACATTRPPTATSNTGPSAVPNSVPSAVPTDPRVVPSAVTGPTGDPEPAVLVQLPGSLGEYAWARETWSLDAQGNAGPRHVETGTLGSTAAAGFVPDGDAIIERITPAGPYVVLSMLRDVGSTLDIRHGRESVGHLEAPGRIEAAVTDPDRQLVYTAEPMPNGGLWIHRRSFDGDRDDPLVELDARFTPDAIPSDHYDLAITASGTLVVFACGVKDGCRIWRIPPGAAAGDPLVIPGLGLCEAIAASDQWLAAYDASVCFADTGDAPLPILAISLIDGSHHVVTKAPQVLARRLVELGDRTVLVASVRGTGWQTSDIVTVDIADGSRRTIVRGLSNGDGVLGWYGVDPILLPGAWVLVDAWGVDGASAAPLMGGLLLDLATDEVIQLPPGTVGWS